MARRKPPAARGGLYEFGAEIDIPVASLDEFDAAIRDANEKGKWLGTDENIEAVIVGAENQAWAIIGPALGISERAERFYRLPGEAWRPYTGQRLEPVVGAVYCFAEALPKHAKGADPRLEWAGRILSFTRRLRDALAEGRAGVAASYAHELGAVYEAGHVEFGHAQTVSAGLKTVRAARYGGEQRAGKLAPDTQVRLAEIARLIDAGHTPSRAFELAARNGYGATAGANRALWYAHRRK